MPEEYHYLLLPSRNQYRYQKSSTSSQENYYLHCWIPVRVTHYRLPLALQAIVQKQPLPHQHQHLQVNLSPALVFVPHEEKVPWPLDLDLKLVTALTWLWTYYLFFRRQHQVRIVETRRESEAPREAALTAK